MTKQPRIVPNTTKDWQIDRDYTKDLLLTFELEDGPSQTLEIAALPEPPPFKAYTAISIALKDAVKEGTVYNGAGICAPWPDDLVCGPFGPQTGSGANPIVVKKFNVEPANISSKVTTYMLKSPSWTIDLLP